MRIVVLGTSEFALPALRRLVESEYEVVGVYTQPDRPAGRGRHDKPSPVNELARQYGLPVHQPPRISAPESVDALVTAKPDVLIAAAYGQILSQPVLDVPPLGVLNIHPSLLPRYRGASPVAAAILAGDDETGVTIMRMVLALDEGPILGRRCVAIDANDTTGTLTERLAREGAELLMETLPPYIEESLEPRQQDPSLASYVSTVKKEDGLIDWTLPAVQIWRRVRAYNPWPGAYTHADGAVLRIHEAWPLTPESGEPPGTVVATPGAIEGAALDAGFAVQTGEGLLAVIRVQKEGRRDMAAKDFLRGEHGFLGHRLS
ncbi:MAG: methionyl-tRNA formyltransferase [Acidobacteria bacterium]|nr:methionyl-tRNA formyltransferase [Acidobacteriota bacterium]